MRHKDWSNFLVSCSGIHEIMSRPKGCNDLTKSQGANYEKLTKLAELTPKEQKDLAFLQAKRAKFNDPPLSEVAKNYLISRYSWEKYNKGTLPTEKRSVSLVKGNMLEYDAGKLISKQDGVAYEQPSDFIKNDYIYGRCDLVSFEGDKMIIDIKVSWSIHSFLRNLNAKLPLKYWWQMQGYMELYDIDNASVRYVLLNTPNHLIERQRALYTEKYLFGEIDSEKYEEEMDKLELCYDYEKIPEKRKVIEFAVSRDKYFMEKVYKKIERCRDWISDFDKLHVLNKKIVTSASDYALEAKKNYTELDPTDTREGDEE